MEKKVNFSRFETLSHIIITRRRAKRAKDYYLKDPISPKNRVLNKKLFPELPERIKKWTRKEDKGEILR